MMRRTEAPTQPIIVRDVHVPARQVRPRRHRIREPRPGRDLSLDRRSARRRRWAPSTRTSALRAYGVSSQRPSPSGHPPSQRPGAHGPSSSLVFDLAGASAALAVVPAVADRTFLGHPRADLSPTAAGRAPGLSLAQTADPEFRHESPSTLKAADVSPPTSGSYRSPVLLAMLFMNRSA